MQPRPLRLLPVAAVALALAVPTSAKTRPTGGVVPRAEQALKAMSQLLGSSKGLRFTTEQTIETVEGAEKLEFTRQGEVLLKRPNRVMVAYRGDIKDVSYWYDGNKLTLLDASNEVWTEADAPKTIDAMLQRLIDRGLVLPLSDLLRSKPNETLLQDVKAGHYIGQHRVGGYDCHHLAFRGLLTDWQIWIDAGDEPWPRKLVVTYKHQDGKPRFSALLDDFERDPKLERDAFRPQIPEGAEKVELGGATPIGF